MSRLEHGPQLPPPLIILAAPRSFTSLVCAMLGQHPEMYGLPETHLFCVDTVREWNERVARSTWPMGHGLLRAIAQLQFGGQDDVSIRAARFWLAARSDLPTRYVFRALADRVFPRLVVDKSPTTSARRWALERTRLFFPRARYLHLARHPRGFGDSLLRVVDELRKRGPIPPSHWAAALSLLRPPDYEGGEADLDPQGAWHARNTLISSFLETVPPERRMRVRAEELLASPDDILSSITEWLGLRSDPDAIEAMKHPEQSPYASLGPVGARYGNDIFFLRDPVFRPSCGRVHSLDGPLPWSSDSRGFTPAIRDLANQLGYQ